jgi:hypothetical protein
MQLNHFPRVAAFFIAATLLGCSPSEKVLSISEIAHNLGVYDSAIKETCTKNPGHQTCLNNTKVFMLIELYDLATCYKNQRKDKDSACIDAVLKKYSDKNPAVKIN